MGVADISWSSKKKNLQVTITIREDSDGDGALDNPVAAAHVNATLTLDSDNDGSFECGGDDTCWNNFGGDTGSNGSVKFSLVGGAPMGDYQMEVTNVSHANQAWNSSLDTDNPDTFTRQ